MKKVHLGFCYVLWALWIRCIWLIGILFIGIWLMGRLLIAVPDLINILAGFNYAYVYNILLAGVVFFSIAVYFLSLLPIEPILFIIALIKEIPKWKKKSFLTVVIPFFITVILYVVFTGAIYVVMINF